MRGYAEIEVFGPRPIELLAMTTVMVQAFPDRMDDEWVRCHEVARAVAHVLFGDFCNVVDGVFGATDHSWIEGPLHGGPGDGEFILDPYAVGRLPMVQLIDTRHRTLPYRELYKERKRRTDIRSKVVDALIQIVNNLEPYAKG